MVKGLREIWREYYHNSPMRQGLIAWYDWKQGSDILEWNPEKGALTGLLASRCETLTCRIETPGQAWKLQERFRKFDNISCSFMEEIMKKQYDYILAVNSFRYYVTQEQAGNMYSQWKSLLKDEGRLLFVVNNIFSAQKKLGIRNAFGREDAKDILDHELRKYFNNVRFYYIFPDYIFPQDIYTDRYPASCDVANFLQPYVANLDEARENLWKLYQTAFVVQNPSLVAGSFLVECSDAALSYDLERIKITLNRGKNGLITKIKHLTVEKEPFAGKMENQIHILADNLRKLKKNQISVIDFREENGKLMMPRLSVPVLSQVLLDLGERDRDSFLQLFDSLYNAILNSSHHIVKSNIWDKKYGKHDWGIVLQTGFVEMTPLNCFYQEEKLLFFDQEYCMEECPARYIMFRCIEHVYMFINGRKFIVSKEELKTRYRLEKHWDYYEKEEQDFLENICHQDDSKDFAGYFSLINQYQYWNEPRISVQMLKYLFGGLEKKRVVCYGTGEILEWFMRGYGAIHPVEFAVSDDKLQWGSTLYGIEVKSLDEVLPDKHRVIITNFLVEEAVIQLNSRNIEDYRFFEWDEWE